MSALQTTRFFIGVFSDLRQCNPGLDSITSVMSLDTAHCRLQDERGLTEVPLDVLREQAALLRLQEVVQRLSCAARLSFGTWIAHCERMESTCRQLQARVGNDRRANTMVSW